jgi:hypothetical protein
MYPKSPIPTMSDSNIAFMTDLQFFVRAGRIHTRLLLKASSVPKTETVPTCGNQRISSYERRQERRELVKVSGEGVVGLDILAKNVGPLERG